MTAQTYRSRDGRHLFTFRFESNGSEVEIYCSRHPSLGERDSDCQKTHIFNSGKLCFVSGRAPQTMSRAQNLARQWAEYLIDYIRTGVAQS